MSLLLLNGYSNFEKEKDICSIQSRSYYARHLTKKGNSKINKEFRHYTILDVVTTKSKDNMNMEKM